MGTGVSSTWSLSGQKLWLRGTEVGSWGTPGSRDGTEFCGPVTQSMGRHDSFQIPWQIVLMAGPKSNGAVTVHGAASQSVARAMVIKAVFWAWARLLKMALLRFGFHQGFMVSYQDHEASITALFFLKWPRNNCVNKDTRDGSSTLPSCWCRSYLTIFNSFILQYHKVTQVTGRLSRPIINTAFLFYIGVWYILTNTLWKDRVDSGKNTGFGQNAIQTLLLLLRI